MSDHLLSAIKEGKERIAKITLEHDALYVVMTDVCIKTIDNARMHVEQIHSQATNYRNITIGKGIQESTDYVNKISEQARILNQTSITICDKIIADALKQQVMYVEGYDRIITFLEYHSTYDHIDNFTERFNIFINEFMHLAHSRATKISDATFAKTECDREAGFIIADNIRNVAFDKAKEFRESAEKETKIVLDLAYAKNAEYRNALFAKTTKTENDTIEKNRELRDAALIKDREMRDTMFIKDREIRDASFAKEMTSLKYLYIFYACCAYILCVIIKIEFNNICY
jgi:hypothetical protein